MKLHCPQCNSILEVPPEADGIVECPSCGSPLDMPAIRTANCPVCCSPLAEEDTVKICPNCKTPHHMECWEENRGCSTYGCASAWHEETHTGESSEGAGMVACPACGAMHPATDLVCSSCGKLLGENLPGDSTGARLQETIGKLGSAAQMHLLPRLARNFRLLGKDIASAFRLWWGEFSRYGVFRGKTTRPSLTAFMGINCAFSILFSCCNATPLVWIEWIVLACPVLASFARRLRDTEISAWMIFAVPLLPFLLLVPSVDSTEGVQP